MKLKRIIVILQNTRIDWIRSMIYDYDDESILNYNPLKHLYGALMYLALDGGILLVLTHELSRDSGCDGSGVWSYDYGDEEVGIRIC